MKIIWQGQHFETNEMIVIAEPIGNALGVFITRDYLHAFAAYMFPLRGLDVIHLEIESVRRMAEESGNPDLLQALQMQSK
jgi:hypothetical protein